MGTQIEGTCGECRFFIPYPEGSDYGPHYGDCRAGPPHRTHDSRKGSGDFFPEESGWPTLHKDDVACGARVVGTSKRIKSGKGNVR